MIFKSYLALDVILHVGFENQASDKIYSWSPEVEQHLCAYLDNFSYLLKIRQMQGFLEFFNFYDIFNHHKKWVYIASIFLIAKLW